MVTIAFLVYIVLVIARNESILGSKVNDAKFSLHIEDCFVPRNDVVYTFILLL